jgi:hypothetical protein
MERINICETGQLAPNGCNGSPGLEHQASCRNHADVAAAAQSSRAFTMERGSLPTSLLAVCVKGVTVLGDNGVRKTDCPTLELLSVRHRSRGSRGRQEKWKKDSFCGGY